MLKKENNEITRKAKEIFNALTDTLEPYIESDTDYKSILGGIQMLAATGICTSVVVDDVEKCLAIFIEGVEESTRRVRDMLEEELRHGSKLH